VIEGDRK